MTKTPTDYQERKDYLEEVRKIKKHWQERIDAEWRTGISTGLAFGGALGIIFTTLFFNWWFR